MGLSRRNSSIVDGEPAVGSMCSSIIALGLTRGHLYTPERPHSGAQLTFTDHKGFRFQVFITDQDDPDLAQLAAMPASRTHPLAANWGKGNLRSSPWDLRSDVRNPGEGVSMSRPPDDWAANLLIGRERFVLVRIRMAEAEQGPLRQS